MLSRAPSSNSAPSSNVSNREILTHSAEETIAQGRQIGAALHAPLLVLLSGDLGAGKTTLTKGIVAGATGIPEEDVTSPTFTLVHKYEGKARVYHIDLYRISDLHDLETLGLEDVFSERAIVIVEWPDRLRLLSGWPILRISLDHVAPNDASENDRRIVIQELSRENLAATREP